MRGGVILVAGASYVMEKPVHADTERVFYCLKHLLPEVLQRLIFRLPEAERIPDVVDVVDSPQFWDTC